MNFEKREDGYPVMAAKGALDKGWQELTWCVKVGRIRPSCKGRSVILKKLFTKNTKVRGISPMTQPVMD